MATIGGRPPTLLLLGIVAACGREESDFTIGRIGVVVRSDAAFVRQADFPGRVASTVAASLAYWGGTWDHLAGTTVAFERSQHVACGGVVDAVACYDGDIRVSTRDPAFVFSCVEQTALVHEIGHAVIGDPHHLDPRWLDFSSVERALSGGRGYLPGGGEAPCQVYPSVWRHPPGQPGD